MKLVDITGKTHTFNHETIVTHPHTSNVGTIVHDISQNKSIIVPLTEAEIWDTVVQIIKKGD